MCESNSDRIMWRTAMADEFESLLANGTWTLVKKAKHMRVIPVRWVFAKKLSPDSQKVRFKARLVAKGFKQRPGIEYQEVYAAVITKATLRIFLGVALSQHLVLRQLDVKTAFLNGVLEEDIDLYMEQPEGFCVEEGFVCKLNKAIYGLKQAPRVWSKQLSHVVSQIGFFPSVADPALYVRIENDGSCSYLLTYVDDFLCATKTLALYKEIVMHMRECGWIITELGFPKQFLSLDISIDNNSSTCNKLVLHQYSCISKLIQSAHMCDAKPAASPMPPNWDPAAMDSPPLPENKEYASLVGSLLYIATCTRPDIAFAVNFLARFSSKPTQATLVGAKRVIRYLKGTAKLGLCFTACSNPTFLAYSDADYAADRTDRRSTTGHLIMFGNTPVIWTSKRQITVAKSTSEADYQALGSVGSEISWVYTLRHDLHLPTNTISVLVDNQSCISWAQDWSSTAKAKHIDVLHHYCRELIAMKKIRVEFVPTEAQAADILTKALATNHHKTLVDLLSMIDC